MKKGNVACLDVERIKKYFFLEFSKLFSMEKGDVTSGDVACLHVEKIHH
jgi:hypothetical protein